MNCQVGIFAYLYKVQHSNCPPLYERLRISLHAHSMGGNGIIAKRRANTLKTTKVLALVTFIFFFSSSLPCIASFSILKHVPTSDTSLVILFFVFRCYFINNCVNPMFYMTLDSRFRQMAKEGLTQLFCKHRQKSKQTVVINTINLYSRRK